MKKRFRRNSYIICGLIFNQSEHKRFATYITGLLICANAKFNARKSHFILTARQTAKQTATPHMDNTLGR